jgi:hypothetical protein
VTFPEPDSAELKRLLRQAFDPGSISRGQDYFRSGRVLTFGVEVRGVAFSVDGEVRGSERMPYTTSVELAPDNRGFAVQDNTCSCPLGGDCKHVVALLLAAVDRIGERLAVQPGKGLVAKAPRTSPTMPWDQWFAAGQSPTAVALPSEAQQRLGFIFDLEPTTPIPSLTVRAVWLSRLKNGAWGKPEQLRIAGFGNAAQLQSLDEHQFALVAALRMQAPLYASGSEAYRIADARAESLVESLLDGQWCCWQKPGLSEIRLGGPLPLRWHWQLQADGSQRLLSDAGNGLLLRAGGLWYFDTAQRRLGRIEHDRALAERLLRVPAELAPEHVAHVVDKWRHQPELAAMPQPVVLAPPRAIAGPPIPMLTFTVTSSAADASRSDPAWLRQQLAQIPKLHLGRLEFDYSGHRIDPSLPGRHVRRMVEGQLLHIERAIGSERTATQMLDSLGLELAKASRHLPWQTRDRATDNDWIPRNPHPWFDPATLLSFVPALKAAGFQIEFAADFPIELLAEPDGWYGEVDESSGEDWFGVELGILIGDERVSLLPILARALEDRSFPLAPAQAELADAVWLAPLDARRRIPLPLSRVRALLAPLLEWLSPKTPKTRVPRLAIDVLSDLQAPAAGGLVLAGATSALGFAERLREAGRDLPLHAPEGLRALPRPYQLEGLRWLQFLADAGLGGVLADDMGLGKTLQLLMHLLTEKARRRLSQPALVVCPTSVVGNWCDQAARFAPDLRVLVLHGSQRAAEFERVAEHDLVITTYALLVRDREVLLAQRFSVAVFDEAQAIKNPRSQAAQVARAIPAARRLAVTGTPLENHLGELWAQLDCVVPGLLGDREHFVRHFRTPIEKHGDSERQARLNRRIAPFMLRRSKESVAPELPVKTIIERKVELAGSQRELYETLRLAMHDRVREALGKRGLAQSSIVILDALLKLRQVCCDPRLIKLDGNPRRGKPPASAKLDLLLEMLEELREEGRRVLLFSQFTGMLDLIEADVRDRNMPMVRLDGSTRDRATPIQRFQCGDVPLFLISLKAGGVGLNLTAADTVIHYDPWWNPAVEAQATDRAHRIGQDKPVFVYKLICTGTVEEKIQALQQRKASLAQAVLEGGSRTALQFDQADIEDLFAPMH